jgi:hypothetical protein
MSKPKAKGTARETWLVNLARLYGLAARRAPNNAPSYDVALDVRRLHGFRVEVKDRQQLNAHKTVKQARDANPGHPVALVWHRTSKPDGARRSRPDGPPLAMVPVAEWLFLLSILDEALDIAGQAKDAAGPEQFVQVCAATQRLVDIWNLRYPGAAR